MATELQQIVSHVVPFLKSGGGASRAPSPIAVWPSDPWPSRSEPDNGQWLLSGLNQYPAGFEAGVEAFWHSSREQSSSYSSRHDFSWLSELKDMGGDQARQSARLLVASWADKYRASSKHAKHAPACNDSFMSAKRILNLLLSYDFHGCSATESYQSLVALILIRDGLTLSKKMAGALSNIRGSKDYFYQSCALISAALCLQAHDEWVEIGEKALLEALEIQILFDGGHISRNPQRLADMLKACLDLRGLYRKVDRAVPNGVQTSIDRMGQALKFFRYTDKKLAVFNGGQEYHEKTLDLILHQAGLGSKIVKTLPKSGFERLSQGRTNLVMDVGSVSDSGLRVDTHLAPLAFELSHGKERMVVNCGAHPYHGGWSDALKKTAAHSTLVINHQDVSYPLSKIVSERTDTKEAVLVEAMQNGYEKSCGAKHVRRVHVSDKGQMIRGEDSLFFDGESDVGSDIGIRFHLHPKVRVSLVKNDSEALLRLCSGIGWSFRQKGARLLLEESVYMGGDTNLPIKTQQLVLYADDVSQNMQVKWAFERER